METPFKDDLVPPGGMYVRTPMPAIKHLTYRGEKSAGKVLYALSLHLGKGSNVVWPGYPTIALFAGISQNNIKKALDVLCKNGYISIKRTRVGRKTHNHYSILPKSYLGSDFNATPPKQNGLDSKKHWICSACYEDVLPDQAEYIKAKDWEGKFDGHWIHTECFFYNHSRRVYEAQRGMLMQQEQYRDQMRSIRSEKLSREENFSGEDESDSF